MLGPLDGFPWLYAILMEAHLEVGVLVVPATYYPGKEVNLRVRLEGLTYNAFLSWRANILTHTRMVEPMGADYTPKQGQYLAFIYYYTKINRVPPAEIDMQRYFQTTPPAVHEMVKTLDSRGFITREPGKPRTIRLLLSREKLPDLE